MRRVWSCFFFVILSSLAIHAESTAQRALHTRKIEFQFKVPRVGIRHGFVSRRTLAVLLFQSQSIHLVLRWSYSHENLLSWFWEFELRLRLEKFLPDLQRRDISDLTLIVDFVLVIEKCIFHYLALALRIINLVYFFRLVKCLSFQQRILHRLLPQLMKSFSCFRR